MEPSSSRPHSGLNFNFPFDIIDIWWEHCGQNTTISKIVRPELLEHASKFYGVKFRNKVILFVISVSFGFIFILTSHFHIWAFNTWTMTKPAQRARRQDTMCKQSLAGMYLRKKHIEWWSIVLVNNHMDTLALWRRTQSREPAARQPSQSPTGPSITQLGIPPE